MESSTTPEVTAAPDERRPPALAFGLSALFVGVVACNKVQAARLDPKACEPKVAETHPWSDYGIFDPAALQQTEVLVRNDGGDWQKVAGPNAANTTVTNVTATSNGFILSVAGQPSSDGTPSLTLWSSPDGRAWSRLATPSAAFVSVDSSGDRIIASDADANVFVSNEAGVTWSAAQSIAALLPGNPQLDRYGINVSAGALGFAAVARVGDQNDAKYAMIHSADGTSWKVTDLAAQGAPHGGYVSGLTVGTDHIDVDYQYNVTRPNGAVGFDLKTLVATPKA